MSVRAEYGLLIGALAHWIRVIAAARGPSSRRQGRHAWGGGIAVALALAGCAERLDHLGRPPTLTKPGQPEAMAVAPPAAARLSLAVPPNLPRAPTTPASLWHAGPRSLFGDRRARVRGDILTVVIDIDEEAAISNETGRSRTGSDEIAIQALLGLPSVADVILPGAGTLEPALSTRSSTATEGEGSVSREEEITLRLAATVERVLPNGHLVIRGSQEIRINFELRDLQISGIVRPEDISRANEIRLDKIADARIVYGGRGQITDVQQPRYGQQVVDMVSPF